MTVSRVESLSPWMRRVTFAGEELRGLEVELPAASVRLLLPSAGTDALVMPAWNGNEFLLSDGSRPAIRTFTPRRLAPADSPGTSSEMRGAGDDAVGLGPRRRWGASAPKAPAAGGASPRELDGDALELDLDMVVHGDGVASEWAERASLGHDAAISGPGRGYEIDAGAPAFLLAGDESAIPAMSQLLEALPRDTPVEVHIEITHDDAQLPMPEHERASIEWHVLPVDAASGDTLLEAVRGATLVDGINIWAAGEAAGVQRIRKHLFEERGIPRSQCTIRGYWKVGRGGDTDG